MNRRSILASIAILFPLAGKLMPLAAFMTPDERWWRKMQAIRDNELFPVLHAYGLPDDKYIISTEITIDGNTGSFIIAAYGPNPGRGGAKLGFAVTRASIEDGHYKEAFPASVAALKDAMRLCYDHPDLMVIFS